MNNNSQSSTGSQVTVLGLSDVFQPAAECTKGCPMMWHTTVTSFTKDKSSLFCTFMDISPREDMSAYTEAEVCFLYQPNAIGQQKVGFTPEAPTRLYGMNLLRRSKFRLGPNGERSLSLSPEYVRCAKAADCANGPAGFLFL